MWNTVLDAEIEPQQIHKTNSDYEKQTTAASPISSRCAENKQTVFFPAFLGCVTQKKPGGMRIPNRFHPSVSLECLGAAVRDRWESNSRLVGRYWMVNLQQGVRCRALTLHSVVGALSAADGSRTRVACRSRWESSCHVLRGWRGPWYLFTAYWVFPAGRGAFPNSSQCLFWATRSSRWAGTTLKQFTCTNKHITLISHWSDDCTYGGISMSNMKRFLLIDPIIMIFSLGLGAIWSSICSSSHNLRPFGDVTRK